MTNISLKALRVNAGLTQSEVGEKLGVSRVTVMHWESYKTFPNSQKLAILADLYQCDMSDIFIPKEFA